MHATRLTTRGCIAGGGPAGLILGLLLARAGVDTVVLEKHADFFRDFRGDTIHPSTIDLLDQLGLRERFEAIHQDHVRTLDVVVNGNRLTPVDFSYLRGTNDYVALMPQWDFLALLAEEGAKYPQFKLMMNTEATGILRDGDRVTGVSAMTPVDFCVAIDVLWFRLPRTTVDPPDTLAYIDAESMLITIPRETYYQAGMLIPKGAFPSVKEQGIREFQERIIRAAPFLATVVDSLENWDQVKLLTVQVNRLSRWWQEGLLCIGDAAHAMSPAFGVGINYAIQDAVATANLLVDDLRAGSVPATQLARVQKRRLHPVARMQPLQLRLHKVIAKPGGGAFLANPMRWWQGAIAAVVLPILRRVTAKIVGRGFRPEKIEPQLERSNLTE